MDFHRTKIYPTQKYPTQSEGRLFETYHLLQRKRKKNLTKTMEQL